MEVFKKHQQQKNAPKLIFFNEKKIDKIRITFDGENWLWKSEIGIFRSLDLERTLIWQKSFLWKSAIFYSILPFDAEVDEFFLNVRYLFNNDLWFDIYLHAYWQQRLIF